MVIMTETSGGHTRRCNASCHNAKKEKCICICGGNFHGAKGKENRQPMIKIACSVPAIKLVGMFGFQADTTPKTPRPGA